MTTPPSLVWFRRDLRVKDNPALAAACASARPVAAVYILDESRFFSPGAAQKWFLHHALISLEKSLARLEIPLILKRGDESATLDDVTRRIGAASVFWNRRYAAEDIETDRTIKAMLETKGVEARSYNGSLIRDPWEIKTKTGGPYRVFTPFWKALREAGPNRKEIGAPARPVAVTFKVAGDQLDDWRLVPSSPDWAASFSDVWRPSEDGAEQNRSEFLSDQIHRYASDRDRPGVQGTSRLSPHLALGTISPLTVWNAARAATAAGAVAESQSDKFLSEIAWREFAWHLLYHNPKMPTEPLRPAFASFPWREDADGFDAWTRGKTGVPIVDAGMRELWRTGWMHNRVRMIVASFLVKNMLTPWQKGERWFWDTLVDADPASNTASWQWVAGCGADAAPYFRIFNPVAQGERFDPDGAYVRTFVPELAAMPNEHVHAPWRAPAEVLSRAGVRLGVDYPQPALDLDQSRKRALASYQQMKGDAA